MKIYQAKIMKIIDENIREIFHELGSKLGYGNNCYFSITFKKGEWDYGYLTQKQIVLVEKCLKKNNISRKEEFLIKRMW